MLLEKDKFLPILKDVSLIFNKYLESITDSLNLFSWPEDISMSLGKIQLTLLLKICLSPKYKSSKEKIQN